MQSNHVKMVFLARCEKKLQRSRLRRVIAGGLYTNRVERSMLLLVSRDHVGSVRNKGCFEVNGGPRVESGFIVCMCGRMAYHGR